MTRPTYGQQVRLAWLKLVNEYFEWMNGSVNEKQNEKERGMAREVIGMKKEVGIGRVAHFKRWRDRPNDKPKDGHDLL